MFKLIKHLIRNTGEFPKRIKRRHEIFWSDPQAEHIRNSKLDASLPMEVWQSGPYWQRKLSNKSNSREFATMMGCKVPDLYWKGQDVDQIDFDSLPAHYVIRPTIGQCSKGVYVMDKGLNLFDKNFYTPDEIVSHLKEDLKKNPLIEFLVEEFVKNENGEHRIPNDYKFLCFNGEIAAVAVIDRVSPDEGYSHFYDREWKKMKKIHYFYPGKDVPERPACFPEMIEHAIAMSKVYGLFVRIDFFATDKGAVFGEFTPTPAMGKNFTPYGKKLLLEHWDKYCAGMI